MREFTKEFTEKLQNKKIQYNIIEDDNHDKVIIDWMTSQQQTYRMIFILRENDSTLRIFPVVNFTEDKKKKVFEICNELNNFYRWIKFYINDDGKIYGQVDLMYKDTCAADFCFELALLTIRIMEEAFPKILQAIYA